jgi:eukaryotic-like serine/threonine-protein kinase
MKLAERPTRPAECLLGLDLEGGWHVDSYVLRPPTSTGGKFSVGYLVVNKDKGKGYLKALDFSAAFQSPDPARALEELTKAYNFERDLLAQCKDQKLRRVVVPLADGWVKVPGNFGDLCNVAYLIFELATGDIRNEVANWQKFDLAWVLRSLHHSAVGLQELHLLGIAHQDLKPSNVLVFPIEGGRKYPTWGVLHILTFLLKWIIPLSREISDMQRRSKSIVMVGVVCLVFLFVVLPTYTTWEA